MSAEIPQSEAQHITFLVRQRAGFLSHLSILEKRAKSNTLEHIQAEQFLDDAAQLEKKFNSNMEKLQKIASDDQYDHLVLKNDEVTERLTDLRILCRRSRQSSVASTSQVPVLAGSVRRSAQTKRPELSLPKFDGSYLSWTHFRDAFTSEIIRDPDLTDGERFRYLDSCVIGDARGPIDGIPVDDSSFNIAWNRLEERFQVEIHICNSHLQALQDVPSLSRPDARGIRKVSETYARTKAVLGKLGPEYSGADPWELHVLLSKLDSDTRERWTTSRGNAPPTTDHLIVFLNSRARQLEEAMPQSALQMMSLKQKGDSRRINHLISDSPNKIGREVDERPRHKCPCCNSDHPLYKCNSFPTKPLSERLQIVRDSSSCINCLGANHSIQRCFIRRGCTICRARHHSLLHESIETKGDNQRSRRVTFEDERAAKQINSVQEYNDSPLLPIYKAIAYGTHGMRSVCQILLDCGANASLVSRDFAKRIKLQRTQHKCALIGFSNQIPVHCNWIARIIVETNTTPTRQVELTLLVVDELSPSFDILIGMDEMIKFFRNDKDSDEVSLPTLLGPLVMRLASSTERHHQVNLAKLTVLENIDRTLRLFWDSDSLEDTCTIKAEHEACESNFLATTIREVSGRFLVALPLRSNSTSLSDNRDLAIRRFLTIERRMQVDAEYSRTYHDFMRIYQNMGHMVEIQSPCEIEQTIGVYYIPHHAVFKPESTTTPFRVVFDASSKAHKDSLSLNDVSMVGPVVQSQLLDILLRFRLHKYALTGDIEKMYRQIGIIRSQQDLQRIVWRNSPSEPLLHYRLQTLTYGHSCAPFLATRCLKAIATDIATKMPELSRVVDQDFYVDDLLTGSHSEDGLVMLKNNLLRTFAEYQLPIRKWNSNCAKIAELTTEMRLDFDDKTVKTLGVVWNAQLDCFTFVINETNRMQETKRALLSDLSRIFDPMGFLAPITMPIKRLFQETWRMNLEWDQQLPSEVIKIWKNIREDLKGIVDIKVPRYLPVAGDYNLHVFCDASAKAYCAVAFLQCVSQKDEKLQFYLAKTKICPIKTITIPRLELNALVLGSDIAARIWKVLPMNCNSTTLWSDSQVAIAWCKRPAQTWNAFVCNRVEKLQNMFPQIQIRYIPTGYNPADIATRGQPSRTLLTNSLWWNGPPSLAFDDESFPETDEEARKSVVVMHVQTQVDKDIDHIFKCETLITGAVMALIRIRFPDHEQHAVEVQLENYKNSLNELIIHDQENFLNNWNRSALIRPLCPFKDSNGVLRVRGRLEFNSEIPEAQRFPVLLTRKGLLTKLILKDAHERNMHAGTLALRSFTSEYWIIGFERAARNVIFECLACRRYNARHYQYLMGSLPNHRTQQSQTFQATAVDLAGPFSCTYPRQRGRPVVKKIWIALFVCLSTRAIHLETVSDLSCDAFIMAFQNFCNVRGHPTDVYSDNGTNFVAFAKQLPKLATNINEYTIPRNIMWHFQPPYGPNFNGLVEAAVKSFKSHFKRSIGEKMLTIEEWHNILCSCAALLNSRPLCQTIVNGQRVMISPSHFLAARQIHPLPPFEKAPPPTSLQSQWQIIQDVIKSIWDGWHMYYLQTLQPRAKWSNPNCPRPQVDDLVLIHDSTTTPGLWPIGRIHKMHPGPDNITRVVTVECNGKEIIRPITKLTPLAQLPNKNSDKNRQLGEDVEDFPNINIGNTN